MNALVTGGAGFIGSALASALASDGSFVRVLDNLSTGSADNVPAEVEFVHGDIRDAEVTTAACAGIDVVFHVAAARSVPRSIDQPILSAETNVLGTLNVLIASERAGVRRVVNSSSSSVYGGAENGASVESMPPDPRSPYAASKAAAEHYCRVWTALKGLATVSLRYFNVYGPGQPAESTYAAVFPAFIKAFIEGRPAEIHWDGEQSRAFTFIEDVVRANLCAAAADGRVDGTILNIGGATTRSVNEVHAAIAKCFDAWIAPEYKPKRVGDVRTTRADITSATSLLGWRPLADWDASVADTVRGFVARSSR